MLQYIVTLCKHLTSCNFVFKRHSIRWYFVFLPDFTFYHCLLPCYHVIPCVVVAGWLSNSCPTCSTCQLLWYMSSISAPFTHTLQYVIGVTDEKMRTLASRLIVDAKLLVCHWTRLQSQEVSGKYSETSLLWNIGMEGSLNTLYHEKLLLHKSNSKSVSLGRLCDQIDQFYH